MQLPKEVFSHIRVAVLPFENLSPDDDMSYFARGFGDDIITHLSRFGGLQIISGHSARNLEGIEGELQPTYIVEGSFRKSGNDVKIGIHLHGFNDSSVLWGEKYNVEQERIFELQDDIVEEIVNALQKQIDYDLLVKSHQKTTGNLQAYDHWLRGMDALRKGTVAHDVEARKHFGIAIEADPMYARAYTGLSLSYFNEWSCQLWERWDVSQKGAHEYALKAIELDPNDYMSLSVLGRTYLYDAEYDKAEHCLRKSIRINPSDADNLIHVASCFTYLGYFEEAIKLYKKAINLNPLHQDWYFGYGSLIYFESGDDELCIELGSRVPTESMWVDASAFMAGAAYNLERQDEMKMYWDQFLEQHRIKILNAEQVDHHAALQWVQKVNPSRGESRMDPFYAFLTEGKPFRQSLSLGNTEADRGDFRKKGESWIIGLNDGSDSYPEVKGFNDIARLLAQPDKELHCAELMGSALRGGTETLVFDEKSRKAYKNRIVDLQTQIAEAEDHNNLALVSKLTEEYQTLIEHLSKSLGFKGKVRSTGSSVEKARSAVTWRIRSAIAKIEKQNPQLAKHLSNSIKTGTVCSYKPAKQIDWEL